MDTLTINLTFDELFMLALLTGTRIQENKRKIKDYEFYHIETLVLTDQQKELNDLFNKLNGLIANHQGYNV